MKTAIALLIGIFFSISFSFASGNFNANNLTPEINDIINQVNKDCNLNASQASKFKSDYILFLNENKKPNANTKLLLALLGGKLKSYFDIKQLETITNMANAGKLEPKSYIPATTTTTTTATSTATINIPAQSNVTELFKQLQNYMKVAPDKAAAAIPILQNYDAQLINIKKENAGNINKLNQEKNNLGAQTVTSLRKYLNNSQINTLVLAITMQENILSGKNISADQKQFLDKIRNQYQLNDVQTMSVVLVLVQGKIRGDAIKALHKTDPNKAGQEFITMMNDLNNQLKTSLTSSQYNKIKTDLEALLKK